VEGADALGLIAEVGIAIARFAGVSSHSIWAVSSSVMVLLIVAIFLFAVRATSRLERAGEEGPPGLRFFAPFIVATYASIIALQVANVAFQRQLWPFHLGLLLMTALSLVAFAYILFAPTRGEVPA
jgi:hypothetical protein